MRIEDRDDVLTRMKNIGRNVPIPKALDREVARQVDAAQRQIGESSEAISQLARQLFLGPNYDPSSGQLFVIDARVGSASFNVMTIAQAAAEGLPAANGFVTFRHGKRIPFTRWKVIDWTLKNPAGPQILDAGGIMRYGSSRQRTVFQITTAAQNQQVLAVIALFAQSDVPMDAKSLAAAGSDPLILAANVTIDTILK